MDYSSLPANAPAGEYLIRIRAGRLPNASADRSFIEYGSSNPSARTGEMTVRGFRKVTGTFEKPQIIEFPLSICHPNERKIGLRERQPNSRDAARAKFKSARSDGQDMPDPAIWIDWVEVKGPIHQKKPINNMSVCFQRQETSTKKSMRGSSSASLLSGHSDPSSPRSSF